MPPPSSSSLWSDELGHEVRTALTSVKVHAQLLSRVIWPTTAEQHQTLLTRVSAIDHAATLAVRHLNRLLEEHAKRWPDDAIPAQETPGTNPAADRAPAAALDGPIGGGSD